MTASDLVLNVDDYEAGRYAKSLLLRDAGFDVAEATTGAEALSLATELAPSVVLLDVNLPDMSGIDVCRRLKATGVTASVPVLQISATFTAATDAVRGLEGGADAYLVEPVDPTVLVATVSALLRLRRAEDTARAAATEWVVTVDAIHDGIALIDASGAVVRCNAAFQRLFGQPAENLHGKPLPALWGLPATEAANLPFARMLRTGKREFDDVRRGSRWLRVTAVPRLDKARLRGAVYVVSDITDWKTVEEERLDLLARAQAARAEAEAANRAKDEFLAIVSHELRAPLTSILAWASILRDKRSDLLDDPMLMTSVGVLERNAKQLRRLIDDLLDVSLVISGKLSFDRTAVDLRPVVEGAVDNVRVAAELKRLRLDTVVGDDDVVVSGDADRLEQVVTNVLSNAVKFTPQGGRVEVRLSRDSHAVLTVSDSGVGMAPDFLPHVFERFRQAENGQANVHRGLGLGLAITRSLVELHGGTVTAASDGVGRGSQFTVRLPLQPAPGDRPDGRGADAGAGGPGRRASTNKEA